MYSLLSHFFPVSFHHLQCIHCLLLQTKRNIEKKMFYLGGGVDLDVTSYSKGGSYFRDEV